MISKTLTFLGNGILVYPGRGKKGWNPYNFLIAFKFRYTMVLRSWHRVLLLKRNVAIFLVNDL